MEEIIGNRAALDVLLGAVRRGKPAGCYIIEGADGTGKLTIARLISAALCCENRKESGEPCLSCHSCRNIMAGRHVDVYELAPEEEGKRITVDQLRSFLRNTYVLPSEGDWRVFIIRNSEKMKKEAQNALLKSIEEPGKQCVFFLLTNDKSLLLPTVRSRAVKLRTEPLSADQLSGILQKEGFDAAKNPDAILLSRGSAGKAMRILSDSAYSQKRSRILQYFQAIFDGASFVSLCTILPPGQTQRSDFSLYLPFFKLALRDILTCAEGGEGEMEFFTDSAFVSAFASIVNRKNAIKLFCQCEDLIQANESNINLFSAISSLHLTSQRLTRPE